MKIFVSFPSILLAFFIVFIIGGQLHAQDIDWGDAPDFPYPTLSLNNGANHNIVLGAPYFDDGTQTDQPDPELDGQPDPTATGDDNDGNDDEDGIVFPTPLNQGQAGTVTITVDDGAGGLGSGGGYVDAWIDFNGDGIWANPGEQIQSGWLPQGPNNINFSVPANAVIGQTFARFRINSTGAGLPPTGNATDGEVEDHLVFIEEGSGGGELDWGDAPDFPYPTLSLNNGANHNIVPGAPYFDDGTQTDQPDPDPDGQPDPTATGDDNDGNDDEDGIVFPAPLNQGQAGTVTITVDDGAGGLGSGGGYVDAWIDFNGDGIWANPGEQIQSGWLPQGANNINFTVPANAVIGQTFARFRINSTGAGLPPTGNATDGEVEDHSVFIEKGTGGGELDWGDAPDIPYPTLSANNGANHNIVPGAPYFDDGTQTDQPDPELDGQPDPTATGDDLNGITPDDEDGIIFPAPLNPGKAGTVTITVDDGGGGTGGGYVDAWIDFNGDGVWANPGEQIQSGWLPQGPNNINFSVPANAVIGQTFARFRINSQAAGLLPTGGPAFDGEVEDHEVTIEEEKLDWGDAPDPTYPTLSASSGANHTIVPAVYMGATVDPELDGQPTILANGDDLAGTPNDEDGVTFITPLIPGQITQIQVMVSVAGWLDVWLDIDQNGNWISVNDYIWSGPVSPGPNPLNISLPYNTVPGQSYMRFRYNTVGALPVTGGALDGEVEDYLVNIEEPELDWGDAPDMPYPTLSSSLGANHIISTGVLLGSIIDPEMDGQPDPQALGDDNNNQPDEDGVIFTSKIIAGSNSTINVVAGSLGGKLDAWIDFNADGIWTHPGEHLWSGASQNLSVGVNSLSFMVPGPPAKALGPSFARFRLSSTGGLPPDNTGVSSTPDGEVEDYAVDLYQPTPTNLALTNCLLIASNTIAQVGWTTQSNIIYQLQSSTNLISNVWLDIEPTVTGPGNWQTNDISSDSIKFYRVEAPWSK